MNDEQQAKLIAALADAFDRAACVCGHKVQAARFIKSEIETAGFKIEARKTKKKGDANV